MSGRDLALLRQSGRQPVIGHQAPAQINTVVLRETNMTGTALAFTTTIAMPREEDLLEVYKQVIAGG